MANWTGNVNKINGKGKSAKKIVHVFNFLEKRLRGKLKVFYKFRGHFTSLALLFCVLVIKQGHFIHSYLGPKPIAIC